MAPGGTLCPDTRGDSGGWWGIRRKSSRQSTTPARQVNQQRLAAKPRRCPLPLPMVLSGESWFYQERVWVPALAMSRQRAAAPKPDPTILVSEGTVSAEGPGRSAPRAAAPPPAPGFHMCTAPPHNTAASVALPRPVHCARSRDLHNFIWTAVNTQVWPHGASEVRTGRGGGCGRAEGGRGAAGAE